MPSISAVLFPVGDVTRFRIYLNCIFLCRFLSRCLSCYACDQTSRFARGLMLWRSGREFKGRFTHSMPFPCRALIHTSNATPLPCSDSAVSFVNVRMVTGNIRTASPQCNRSSFYVVCCYHSFSGPWQTVFSFTLATCIWDWYASDKNFVQLRVVAGRSQTRASSQHVRSRRPCCAVALRRRAWSGVAWVRHGKRESDTAALCKSNGKDTF